MNAIDLIRRSIDIAHDVSMRAFLNSLMREWQGWTMEHEDTSAGSGRLLARFPLPRRGGHVAIEMTHRSRAAYHGFRPPFLEFSGTAPPRPISFQEFVFLLASEPDIVGSGDKDRSLTFLSRVLDSIRNIEDVAARVPSPDAYFAQRDPSFAEAEGSLRFGHAVHPTPRSRDQFTLEDSRRFAPEYRQGFALRWWAADPALVLQDSSRTQTAAELCQNLAAGDPAMDPEVVQSAKGRVLLPMHPWQAAQLALDPAIDGLFRRGLLKDLGHAGSLWQATSSLRAIHAPHADWMLKFSLSLRLTNSRRVIETRECERGIEIDRLLAGEVGRTIARRFPSFKVMGEPAYLLLQDADGKALPQTTVILRENPFKGASQPPAAVLAALCEIYPDGHDSALATIIRRIAGQEPADPAAVARRWFRQFLDKVVAPFLLIQADIGLLFGAHQQNIVVELAEGWPAAVHFRDCQGTGYIREFLPELARKAPGSPMKAGHVFNSDEAAQLVGYYLLVNSVFAVIGALGTSRLIAEDVLIGDLRAFLEELAALPLADKTCLTYLLTAPTLGSKGNFMICFRNINENTEVTDPLAGYVPLSNPIAEAVA
ncbi:IucA/IucC family siderophore biosynthesis protein [Labrys portucalensis]|uniref:IucA/IucC family siderophore biosynthesis protein n=1 Tax=Labrys neptuniae TaxID=376174 RepID=A0ABV6ZNH5_9HYPH